MAKKHGDGEKPEPTLELPSLFGRGRKRRSEPVEPSPAPEPLAESEHVAAAPELEVEPEPQPATEPEPVAVAPEPEPEPEPVTAEPAPTEPGPVSAAAPTAKRKADRKAARRAPRSGPVMSPWLAAGLTGLLVGAVGTALTYAALQGCEIVRGTESCGGPGLFVLVAILALMVIAGSVLLKLLGVSEPRGTSFLAIGVTTVVILVTLMESLFSPWMFIAVPVINAASYVLAEWVTTRFVEQPDSGPTVDVR